jgi:hypothetical protein
LRAAEMIFERLQPSKLLVLGLPCPGQIHADQKDVARLAHGGAAACGLEQPT